MINIKRRVSNIATNKALLTATKAIYDIDATQLSKLQAVLEAQGNKLPNSAGVAKEHQWVGVWLDQARGANLGTDPIHIKRKTELLIETNNGVSYIDTEQSNIDIHNARYKYDSRLSSEEISLASQITAKGVCNSFRFYKRPNTRIVVLDYLKILDCIALYYAYREFGLSIEKIDCILQDCAASIMNKPNGVYYLIKYCLGGYIPLQENISTLIEQNDKTSKDGELYNLVSELRISNDCYQLIHSVNEVETWQHHRVTLKPKMTYDKVLDISQTEFLVDLLNGIAIEIENTKELTDVKVISIDNGCVALSVPINIDNKTLVDAFSIALRLFNRQFAIPCKLYNYNEELDQLIEETENE